MSALTTTTGHLQPAESVWHVGDGQFMLEHNTGADLSWATTCTSVIVDPGGTSTSLAGYLVDHNDADGDADDIIASVLPAATLDEAGTWRTYVTASDVTTSRREVSNTVEHLVLDPGTATGQP